MKKLWLFALLISLGLNLGLLWRVVNLPQPAPAPCDDSLALCPRCRAEFAQRPAPGDSSMWNRLAHRRLDRLSEQLDLAPEQQRTLADLHETATESLRMRRGRIEQAKQGLHDLIARKQVPPDSLRLAIGNLATERGQLDSLVTEVMLQELDVLDDRQRRLYLQSLPLDRSHRGDRYGGQRGRGHGKGRERQHP